MKRRIVFLAGLSIVLGWVAVAGFLGLFGRPVHADSFTLPVTDVADVGSLAADVTDTGHGAAPGPAAIPLFGPGDCTVTSTLDSGPGSLRACIAQLGAGDMITFDPVVFPPGNPQTITVNSALPAIVTDNVTIDGSDAGVILNGGSGLPGDTIGLVIDGASHVVIKGLQILNFPGEGIVLQNGAKNNTIGGTNGSPGGSCSGACNLISGNHIGVVIKDSGTMHNTVSGNYIGTTVSGTEALGNRYNGVGIREGAQYNLIGGSTDGERNLISGNGDDGVFIGSSGTMSNTISGNYIGTNVSGTAAISNEGNGVRITYGAQYNLIGGDTAEERNLISSNGKNGVRVKGPDTMRNTVSGNYIGTNVSGTTVLGNGYDGVKITDGAQDNLIGGSNASPGDSCTGHCNLISGNIDGNGVTIRDSGTMSNTVSGNYIGTNVSGTEALSNTWDGVRIVYGAQYNLIGGDTPEERNVISGNDTVDVEINGSGTMHNTVSGNYIGTNASGTAAIGNAGGGVWIWEGAQYNLIGGDTAGERNIISGHGDLGVGIASSGTMHNTVSGNYIGTNASGTAALGNGGHGVNIGMGAQYNVIGSDTEGERNVISGNGRRGVNIRHSSTMSNTVSGNYIGTNASGTEAIGNTESGVSISQGAQYNLIGGDTPGKRNIISGNGKHGVRVKGLDTMRNTVSGNYIGTNASGTAAIGNAQFGVVIGDGAQYNLIGGDTPGKRNIISGNGQDGVLIHRSDTLNNTVSGNYIGSDVTGTAALGNHGAGVAIVLDALGTLVLSNSIFSNDGLGINLGLDGVTTNDLGDGDTGANNLQNFPVLTSATSDATSTTILGALNSIPNTTFRLEFFSNTACDPSGFGEGQALLGSTTVTTDGSGDASFTVTFPTPVPEGQFVTATATDPDNNTSEFCQCLEVDDGISDPVDGEFVGGLFVDQSTVFSDNFTDEHLGGTSFGSIVDRDGLVVTVQEAVNPAGLRLEATGGPGVATVGACNETLLLTDGDMTVITCGSLTAQVLEGPIEILLGADIVVTVPSETTATVTEVAEGQFEIENSPESTGTIVVEFQGGMIELDPGESGISVIIDIKPGSDPNCFNNDGHGVIPVAILSSADFDATRVDPSTVSLNGQAVRVVGKGNMQAHIEDVNSDGLVDLVVQIEDMDGTYQEGDTIATLTGETCDGTSILGTDTICIVP